jgi:hypothetical protein
MAWASKAADGNLEGQQKFAAGQGHGAVRKIFGENSAEIVSHVHHQIRRFEALRPFGIEFMPLFIVFAEGPIIIDIDADQEEGRKKMRRSTMD